uniref:phosphoserine transaminase n=1 Tax=Entamoeba invadens TaxID=33085 RepID=S0B0G5_ENTIV|nr:phosphoserine aminotransferase, putative [Entamoeba invadens]
MRTGPVHNFGAGPCALADEVIENTTKAVQNFKNGMSLLEISHRSKDWMAIMDETVALFKEVLNIPAGYSVLFLGGGASLQFLMVAMNLLEKKAAYLDTGVWASKAIKEAKAFGEVQVVASSKDKNYTYIPEYKIPEDVDYFHITTNNTIYGSEIKKDIDCPVKLVADMSSDILSRPVDVSKYALIYAGAQKNCGCAGVTIVIVKDEVLGHVSRQLPSMMDYKIHIANGSMYSTPPVISIYTINQTLKWVKKMGGVEAIHKMNEEKAKILYEEIDRNKLFRGTVEKDSRSIMNICFVMNDEYKALEEEFYNFATKQGMIGIKGHRSVGGFRASCYNAVRIESVKPLVSCMQEFEKLH